MRGDWLSKFRKGLSAAALAAIVPTAAGAQTTLTLEEAMARARAVTPGARSLAAATAEAAARVDQARAGYFPRVDVSESLQRGNQPVYVFSSLLSQRRFAPANFEIGNLNDPAPLTNVRSSVTIEQRVYDPLRGPAVNAAELHRELTTLERTRGAQDLALDAARAFVRVLQLEASDRANGAAIASAESDLALTRARRDAGLVTSADVLAVDVHLADVRQQQIATAGDLVVARLLLAEALGLPIDHTLTLVRPVPARQPAGDAPRAEASDSRPERPQAALRVQLAESDRRAAQAALFPRVDVQASWDFNGSTWTDQRSGWLVGARIDWNVFNGFANRARMTEARQAEVRAEADQERTDRRIDVEVRAARAQLDAARAREAAGRAARAQAIESQRIIRDRYETGLATITDVLRAADAALAAESRATAAELDVILQTVALDHAIGRL